MRTSVVIFLAFVLSASLCLAAESYTNTWRRNLLLSSNEILVTNDKITSNVESADLRTLLMEIAKATAVLPIF